jgi:glycerophosphoryl diester phosphodiesterase
MTAFAHHRTWPYARVLAHRGGGTLAPENTVAAIREGLARGFHAIEFDAMLAADDVPVLIHDSTLERTTTGHGDVAALTAAQLAQLDAGRWFSRKFASEPVPTMAGAVSFCRARDIWINIEIKPAPGFEAPTGDVVARQAALLYADVVRAGGDRADHIEPRVPLCSSFSEVALAAAHAAAPDLPRGWLIDRVPDDWAARIESLGCVSLHTNHRHLTPALARAIKSAGYWLFCYTVNEAARATEILSWGVDAFCTDRIDVIGADFAERAARAPPE